MRESRLKDGSHSHGACVGCPVMMDDLESSVDSDKSGSPSKCPRLIIDNDERPFGQISDKIGVEHNHLGTYTHLNEITDLRHESLNQLLRSNIELIKNEHIELKPIAGRSKIVYANQNRANHCGCISSHCRHTHVTSDHNNNNNGSIGGGIAAFMDNCRSDCNVSMCHRSETHQPMQSGSSDGGDSAQVMLIGGAASQYGQLLDEESKHCTSIDDKVVSSLCQM